MLLKPTGNNEVNVLALVKGDERYIFIFDDNNKTETLRQIGRYAANPELSFTWYDAAVMSQKIRQTNNTVNNRMKNFILRFSVSCNTTIKTLIQTGGITMNFLDLFKPKRPTYGQCVKSTELLALEAKYKELLESFEILDYSHRTLSKSFDKLKDENHTLNNRVQELGSREEQFTKFTEIVRRMFEECGKAIDSLPEDLNRPLEENE